MHKNSDQKLLGKTFAVILLIITIFSTLFPAIEADHHCLQNDCPVCFVISICKETLKTLIILSFFFSLQKLFFHTEIKEHFYKTLFVYKSNTLVSQKIRLND